MKISFLFLAFISLALSIHSACASPRPLVAVTVPAQAWLVNQIAGEKVDIMTMIPAGRVPESAQPGPRNLSRLQQADIHVIVGDPSFFYEIRYVIPYRENTETPGMPIWLSMYDIAAEEFPSRGLKSLDPHLWTSPSIMLATAKAIEQAMSRLDPENVSYYQNNLSRLQEKISKFDREISAVLKRKGIEKLLVYHPAWGHFCQDFGLQQIAVEDEGKSPGAASLTGLFAGLEKNNTGFMISSPGADQRPAAMVATQLKINLVLINPMDPDWMQMMQAMQESLEKYD